VVAGEEMAVVACAILSSTVALKSKKGRAVVWGREKITP
jgi:hypothetical protein